MNAPRPGTATGEPFDRLVALARRLLRVPYAVVRLDAHEAPVPGILARIDVPLFGEDGETLAVFSVMDMERRDWSAEERALLGELAALAQHELDLRAARDTAARGRTLALMQGAEDEHTARTLEAALQPEVLPRVDGVRMAARYQPAESRLGGDWYDAFRLPDGRMGVAIGDVVGHGIEAAALALRLRNALRGAVLEGHEPGEAVLTLNGFAERERNGMASTMLYATIDPRTRRMHWANAGHLPPVAAAGGAVHRLAPAERPPLGTIPADDWPEHELVLERSARVVLYTDGLIERRGEQIDRGIDRVARVALEQDGLEAACEAALATAPRPRRDDVAVVALELE